MATPTTDDVREGWADFRDQTSWTYGDSARAEFDRWLAQVEAAAERRGAVQALRDAAGLSRRIWTRTTNLPHPTEPETACSFDNWLEALAEGYDRADAEERGE